MLSRMCEMIKVNRIRDVFIKDSVKVPLIVYEMRESRLRWFGHYEES